MDFDKVIKIANKFKFQNFTFNAGGNHIKILHYCKDVDYPDKPEGYIVIGVRWYPEDTEDELVKRIWIKLQEIWIHELSERCKYDGKHLQSPHNMYIECRTPYLMLNGPVPIDSEEYRGATVHAIDWSEWKMRILTRNLRYETIDIPSEVSVIRDRNNK